jgi:hypothetical protein
MTEQRANAIYDILVKHAGARESSMRDGFVWHHAENDCTEFRFMGSLGFGGKYYSRENRVDCYSEDETPERRVAIGRTNAALAEVAADEGGR